MRYVFVRICPWLLIAGQLMAADPITDALQKGLFEEEANHNLEAAIKAYQSVLDQTAEQRKLTANAVFRLGECYRKLNKTNEAVAHYQRLTREFPDQTDLVTLSEQNLLVLAPGPQTAVTNRPPSGNLAEQAELNRLKRLAKDNPDLLHAGDDQGDTPLHKVATRGYLKAAEFLLANKADVNAPNRKGTTPLQYAVLAGHRSMVELLLAKGADVKVFGSFKHEDPAKTNWLRGQALHVAVFRGDQALAELLLNHKAEPNGTDGGHTPLRFAVEQGYLGLVRLLVSKGADINMIDGYGETPAMRAVAVGHENIVRFLIESGVDLSTRTRYGGATLLHYAAGQRSPGVLKAVLEHRPNLEMTNEMHETPLMTAVKSRYPQPVELLLQAGANPNSRTPSGSSPLFAAVEAFNKEAVRLLLAHKADPNQTNPEGITALNRAVAMYLEHPVDVPFRNTFGEIAELLWQAGGAGDRKGCIGIARDERQIVHGKFLCQDSRQWNRYTLFELLCFIYDPTPYRWLPWRVHAGSALKFPDFARIRIDRLTDGKGRTKIELNLETALASGDCAQDVPLEWGDIVEIPEKQHRPNELSFHLPDEIRQTLVKCLARDITVTARGQTTPVHLYLQHLAFRPSPTEGMTLHSLRLKDVVSDFTLRFHIPVDPQRVLERLQKGLGFSGHGLRELVDLKQVMVVRKSPETGEDWKMIFNAEGPSDVDDLHLRNGDAIYLPDKQ